MIFEKSDLSILSHALSDAVGKQELAVSQLEAQRAGREMQTAIADRVRLLEQYGALQVKISQAIREERQSRCEICDVVLPAGKRRFCSDAHYQEHFRKVAAIAQPVVLRDKRPSPPRSCPE